MMRNFLLVIFFVLFGSLAQAQTEDENYSYCHEVVRRADCNAMQCGYVFDAPIDANTANQLKAELYLFDRGVYNVRFSSDLKKIRIDHISYVRVPALTAFLSQQGITCVLDYSGKTEFKNKTTNEIIPATE